MSWLKIIGLSVLTAVAFVLGTLLWLPLLRYSLTAIVGGLP